MVTISIILDLRSLNKKNEAPLKIRVANGAGNFALHGIGYSIAPDEWDKTQQRAIGKRHASLNAELDSILIEWKNTAKTLPALNSALEIKNAILAKLQPGRTADGAFYKAFCAFIERKHARTRVLYKETLARIEQHETHAKALRFEDITAQWLERFDAFLALTAPSVNSRGIHFRNIRAVFNYAIEEELTALYPFRKFKIKTAETLKRSLSVDDLRFIFNYTAEPHAQKYVDVFKLIFLLIGINIKDLCELRQVTNGRAEYIRAKTHKVYSIKIEPEARELLEQFIDDKGALNIAPNYANYKDYAKKVNMALQRVGDVKRVGNGGKKIFSPLFPQLTTYWARHTWATIAAELDIPNEVIAQALGHSYGNRITNIYIRYNEKKIDEANRRVIDYVLYDKK